MNIWTAYAIFIAGFWAGSITMTWWFTRDRTAESSCDKNVADKQ